MRKLGWALAFHRDELEMGEELTESGRCPSRSEWQAARLRGLIGGWVGDVHRLRSAGCCNRSWTLVELMGSANLILRNFITCRTLLERSQDLFFPLPTATTPSPGAHFPVVPSGGGASYLAHGATWRWHLDVPCRALTLVTLVVMEIGRC